MESISINQDRVRQIAESSIKTTLERHGISDRAQLKDEAIQDAYKDAEERVRAETERAQDPYFLENQRLREQLRLSQMQTTALRDSKQPVSPRGEPAELTLAKAQARVGQGEWNHGLTTDGRLAAVGIDPSTVTSSVKAEVLEILGPQANSARASELKRSDPAKYNRLKLIGKTLRII